MMSKPVVEQVARRKAPWGQFYTFALGVEATHENRDFQLQMCHFMYSTMNEIGYVSRGAATPLQDTNESPFMDDAPTRKEIEIHRLNVGMKEALRRHDETPR